ncbi:EGF-like protein [Turkeypox virus]|uniref:EGF-like protein n=1 Tax=Turkeypox virus TaxID=336486 RepID=A0A0M3ZPQ3_9POXV|nr:EGF-like protein [Turkeypox virus]ALA62527.1 EGF-like protein [Turkeypox virus]
MKGDIIPLIQSKKEYAFIRSILGNKIPKYVIILLMIFNIIFYSNRMSQLMAINNNARTYPPLSSIIQYKYKKDNKKNISNNHYSPFEKCKSNFNSFCINGECRYVRNLEETVCLCEKGYSGRRCEIFGLSEI